MPVWMQISVPTSMEVWVMPPAKQFCLAHLHRCQRGQPQGRQLGATSDVSLLLVDGFRFCPLPDETDLWFSGGWACSVGLRPAFLQHLSQFSEHLIMTQSVPALRQNYLAARHNLPQAGILSITETAA